MSNVSDLFLSFCFLLLSPSRQRLTAGVDFRYPMSEATWIPKENLVGGDTTLFSAFLEDAAEEGANLSKNVVLLQEALEAGWGSEAC